MQPDHLKNPSSYFLLVCRTIPEKIYKLFANGSNIKSNLRLAFLFQERKMTLDLIIELSQKQKESPMDYSKPYVGVTGFMTPEEVRVVSDGYSRNDTELMVGILMSSKTLRGKPNRYPNKYPKREEINKIFQPRVGLAHYIHYSTDNPEHLAVELMAMIGMFGQESVSNGNDELCGFQLNVFWPTPEAIEDFRKMCFGTRRFSIILQVGANALSAMDRSPERVAAKLKEYRGLVEYVLIDPSGGTGRPLKVDHMRNYVRAIRDTDPPFGIGIAGGLCAEALQGEVADLIREFPGLCIDAEGKLRDPDDNLDIEKTRSYLEKAIELFASR